MLIVNMSQIPPYQMGSPDGGAPPKKSSKSVWIWVVVGCAGMCLVCGVLGAAVLFPVFAQARIAAKKANSLSNAKRIALSVAMYSSDFDDRMPPIDNGPAVASRLDKYFLKDSSESSTARTKESLKSLAAGYTWNTAVSKLVLIEITNPNDVWMFYSTEPADMKSVSMAYMDNHVKIVSREKLPAQTAVQPIIKKLGK